MHMLLQMPLAGKVFDIWTIWTSCDGWTLDGVQQGNYGQDFDLVRICRGLFYVAACRCARAATHVGSKSSSVSRDLLVFRRLSLCLLFVVRACGSSEAVVDVHDQVRVFFTSS